MKSESLEWKLFSSTRIPKHVYIILNFNKNFFYKYFVLLKYRIILQNVTEMVSLECRFTYCSDTAYIWVHIADGQIQGKSLNVPIKRVQVKWKIAQDTFSVDRTSKLAYSLVAPTQEHTIRSCRRIHHVLTYSIERCGQRVHIHTGSMIPTRVVEFSFRNAVSQWTFA